ncbi:MAG TPA: hypothetical protein VF608_08420, partial [Thermoanaerobaculia bacterium]
MSALLLLLSAGSAFAQAYTFEQLSWADGGPRHWDGTGGAARFYSPMGLAADAAGNLYIADTSNHVVRKITPAGEVMTLAGVSTAAGSVDGRGAAARFFTPMGIAVDATGNVYIADYVDHTIRKITPSGMVTTLAGFSGQFGTTDGSGSAARFRHPSSIAVDGSGNVFVADYWNHTIRKITPAGDVSTFAGLAETPGTGDGTGSGARFYYPTGLAIAPGGDLYVTEELTHRIRKISTAAVVTTVAGVDGGRGNADGTGSAARFDGPSGLTVDATGTVFIADSGNHMVRRMTPAYAVTKLAGNPEPQSANAGSLDGAAAVARFHQPRGVAVDADGNVFVADTDNHTIRKITPGGAVTTFAGRAAGGATIDGEGAAARVNAPRGIAVDDAGTVYFTDAFSHVIRKATAGGTVSTIAGLADTPGSANGTGTAARFRTPGGIAVAGDGTLFVADTANHTIRKITPLGEVSTLAGLAGVSGDVDETGSLARFQFPRGLVLDGDGNLFVADSGNDKVKMVTDAGVVTTLAVVDAQHLVFDNSGNLLVTDDSSVVWSVTPGGVVSKWAGNNGPGGQGSVDGPRLDARFYGPDGIGRDASGVVYVADRFNHTIRRIGTDGIVTTPAGVAGAPDIGGSATATHFLFPGDLEADSAGTVYVTDRNDTTIKRGRPTLATDPTVTPAAGFPGTQVQLNVTQPATTYSWRVVRRPAGSVAQLSSATIANPTFTPDVADRFTFQLRADSAAGLRIAEVNLEVASPSTVFWTLQPCRVIDTRDTQPLAGSATKTVTVAGVCGVPSGARAIAANVTAV